ncbi:F-box protein At3g07870-like [Papaver somniferum]|uniref:F-box protein At3g07870-like n=1 Tax=Papaver somniferum TaxID=3469 RepID=UPI000E6FFA2D|nr:F-box protein At3g07870-like [Papaver somniferum]
MEKLPEDVIPEILSRLPVETKLQCKHVCRTWRKLLDHVKVGTFIALGFEGYEKHNNARFFYTEKAHDGINIDGAVDFNKQYPWYEVSRYERQRRNVANWFDNDIIVGSSNGLVCLAIVMLNIHDPVFVFNPFIPEEFITLPPIRTSIMDDGRLVVSGFGYARSTDEYKVIRVYYSDNNDDPDLGQVEVYTIGSGYGWRNKGEISYRLCDSPGVLVDGVLHWLDYKQRKIVAFDLVTEEFRDFLSPPCFWLFENVNPSGASLSLDNFRLRVLGGFLCLVHKNKGKQLNIWALKRKEGKVHKCEWVWSKEFSKEYLKKDHTYQPSAITKNNKLLLQYGDHNLLWYDPKIAALVNFSDHEQLSEDVKYFRQFLI